MPTPLSIPRTSQSEPTAVQALFHEAVRRVVGKTKGHDDTLSCMKQRPVVGVKESHVIRPAVKDLRSGEQQYISKTT